jgi:ribosomal protein L29
MKKNNNTLLREKDTENLSKELSEVRAQLRMHRFNTAGARAKDSSLAKKSRAQVARILTELGARSKKAIAMTNI